MTQAVLEVTRPEALQHDAGDERRGQDEPAACEQGERTDEREEQRREAGDAARLRERDRVGEVDEEPRHLGQQQHRQRAREGERRPAASEREPGERQQEQRGDGDGAAAAEDLGREAEVVLVAHDELVAVVLQPAQALARPGVVRHRLVDDRPQPEQDERRRHERGPEQGRIRPPLAARAGA